MKEALVIGRFQIVGNQHVDFLRQVKEHMEREQISRLNVGIGVSGKRDERNPFKPSECLEMLKPVVEEIGFQAEYHLIPDINDPPDYAEHVSQVIGKDLRDIVLFSGNPYTNQCFRGRCRVVETEERIRQHSTQLRRMAAHGKDISSLVPRNVVLYLQNLDKGRTVRREASNTYKRRQISLIR